ncbi:MAG: hypothetical protein KME64_18810 [Scytonematopsis contorta HA4267-MV1]|jgi:hypothetical protein|nr:hypothetical protein [Scytonematopsis contorta HA4267-MV1]
MKTLEDLKTRIKELAKETVALQTEGVALLKTDFEKSRELTRKAHETSKRCGVLLQEFNRRRKREE